jgi:hypothetical protein
VDRLFERLVSAAVRALRQRVQLGFGLGRQIEE